jgi:hypothetical protein
MKATGDFALSGKRLSELATLTRDPAFRAGFRKGITKNIYGAIEWQVQADENFGFTVHDLIRILQAA